ncbi:hypothetical protein GCM10011584_11270 [Nocardioides phosphati]|uniref:HNH endonuclease n=1 Tax=Nocardioides phosphati TaxID=1867775 RepID=A0ABQ2N9N9_9ACTN|nr:hypothetical protein [Nocardioides phosphati]GGO87209.1 hypothetical protein GCM10011584_11270 [Nocardioides phosphati]
MASSGMAFADLSRSALLDTATALSAAERRAQVDQLRLALEWALANGPDSLDPDTRAKVGRASVRLYGGQGTPQAATTAGADLGARLGRSTAAGDSLIADAQDLRFRLPEHWSRVKAHEVAPSYARFVARRTRELSPEAALYVDHAVATYSDGRIPWSRFEATLDAAIKAADPAVAEAREKAARERRYAFAARETEDGMRSFVLRTDAFGVARLDATVSHLAEVLKALGCAEPVDHRRALAMVLLANPAEAVKVLAAYATWRERPADPDEASDGAGNALRDPFLPADPAVADDGAGKDLDGIVADADELWRTTAGQSFDGAKPVIDWTRLLPSLTVFVHLYGGRIHTTESPPGQTPKAFVGADRGEAPEIIRIEGIGTATEAWLRTHFSLHPAHKVTVRPVIDLERLAPVDAWEVPERHRQAVRLMTPADCFPWGSATTNRSDGWSGMQVDHTNPWQPDGGPGQSAIGNYGPLTQFHHNLKTHCGWDVKQPYPGIYVWRDPAGAHYLVDNTGTRRL